MKLKIEIDCSGAAFDPENGGQGFELSRILGRLAATYGQYGVYSGTREITLHDHNGNKCGKAKVTGK